MNSFDVFDTLLARRFVTAKPLFERIEKELDIADFTVRRLAADDGSSSLREIYQKLGLPDSVMNLEIALEFDNAIPIRQNLQRVAHGDLLISDMYMSASDILRMVRGVGLDKQVTIFQSNAGKSSGEVWRRLASHKPDCHVGDNVHSDYNVPTAFGFNCELYSGAALTQVESVLTEQGLPALACLIREIRLGAEETDYAGFFVVADQFNLPWLFLSAEFLRRRHRRPMTFLGRDGQLLSRIFNAYFAPCYYLPFSRRVAFTQPAEAVAYLMAHSPPDGLFVDISSTGATWQKLQSNIPIEVLIYLDLYGYMPDRPLLPAGFSFLTTSSQIGQTNSLLEIFNCGDHGYLNSVEILSDGLMQAKFDLLQVDKALVDEIQRPVRLAERLAPIYRERVLAELGQVSSALLLQLFGLFTQEICSKAVLSADPLLTGYYRHEAKYKALLLEADAASRAA